MAKNTTKIYKGKGKIFVDGKLLGEFKDVEFNRDNGEPKEKNGLIKRINVAETINKRTIEEISKNIVEYYSTNPPKDEPKQFEAQASLKLGVKNDTF